MTDTKDRPEQRERNADEVYAPLMREWGELLSKTRQAWQERLEAARERGEIPLDQWMLPRSAGIAYGLVEWLGAELSGGMGLAGRATLERLANSFLPPVDFAQVDLAPADCNDADRARSVEQIRSYHTSTSDTERIYLAEKIVGEALEQLSRREWPPEYVAHGMINRLMTHVHPGWGGLKNGPDRSGPHRRGCAWHRSLATCDCWPQGYRRIDDVLATLGRYEPDPQLRTKGKRSLLGIVAELSQLCSTEIQRRPFGTLNAHALQSARDRYLNRDPKRRKRRAPAKRKRRT